MRLFDIDSREDYLLDGKYKMVGAKRRSRTEESQSGD